MRWRVTRAAIGLAGICVDVADQTGVLNTREQESGPPRVCWKDLRGSFKVLAYSPMAMPGLRKVPIGVFLNYGWEVAGDRAEVGTGRPCRPGYRKKAAERDSCRAAAKAGSALQPIFRLAVAAHRTHLSHLGADVKLFPACRNESRFVLSIKPEPVSTKLGTGA